MPLSRFVSFPFLRPLSLPLRFLSSAPASVPQLLSLLALPFRFFPRSPCASSLGAPSLLSSLRFSPSFRTGFPFLLSGSAYLVLCLVSFRPSRLRSRSRSAGARSTSLRFLRSASRFPLLPLSFVRFRLGSDYSACASSFPLFPLHPHTGLPGAVPFPSLPFVRSVPFTFPLSLPAVSIRPFLLRYSAFLRFPFPTHFRLTGATFLRSGLPFRASAGSPLLAL